MSKQWAKEQVHRNEIASYTDRIFIWIDAHREAALGVTLTGGIALFLIAYVFSRQGEVRKSAWESLAMAQSHAFAGQGDAALKQLGELKDKYGNTKAAGFAELFQGDLLFRAGKHKEAIEAYQAVVASGEKRLEPFAMAGVAAAQEAGGDLAAASESARQFLDRFQDHFMAPQVQTLRARALVAQGQVQEAQRILENIVLLYPDTLWSQAAQEALKPPAAQAPKGSSGK